MSQIRVNFLNWRPDQEDSSHDGLTVAENIIHDTEGYKQLLLASAGAVSTAISGFATGVALHSAMVRQVGSKRDASTDNKIHCYLGNSTALGLAALHVGAGTNPSTLTVAATLTAAGGTASPFATAGGVITAFDVCELGGSVFVTAEAKGDNALGQEMSANITAYMTIALE